MQKRLLAVATALAAGMLIAACAPTASSSPKGSHFNRNNSALALVKLTMQPGAVLPAAATQGIRASDAVHAHPAEIRLWSGPAPGSENQTSPEIVNWRTETDTVSGELFSFPTVTNIHVPSITPYLPEKSKATGAAVIIAPGGGHMFLTINHEGYDLAQYFADRGVAAFVLKYRLPRSPAYPANTYTVAETVRADSVRAVRLVRSRAAEWGLNPDAIGVMGFSAGGDVVAQIHLHPDAGNPTAADPIERFPCKVNFEAPVYTSSLNRIDPTKDSPPIFLLCSEDDGQNMSGLVAAANASTRPALQGLADVYLKYKAVGVPAEIHIYSIGGHGFGARERPIEEARWKDSFLAFLKDRGFSKPQ